MSTSAARLHAPAVKASNGTGASRSILRLDKLELKGLLDELAGGAS